MRLSEAIQGFTYFALASNYSTNTLIAYRTHYRQMIAFLGDCEIENVTRTDLQRFFAWSKTEYKPVRANGDDKCLALATVRNAWCATRSLFKWAAFELKIERPDLALERPRPNYPEIISLTEEDIRALLKACEYTTPVRSDRRKAFVMHRKTAARDVALVLLLLDTGLRVGECAQLKVEDLNLERRSAVSY